MNASQIANGVTIRAMQGVESVGDSGDTMALAFLVVSFLVIGLCIWRGGK